MNIRYVDKDTEKGEITKKVLEELPEWFGIPESTREYVEESRRLPYLAAENEEGVIGFLAIKATSDYTAEVYVMGVLKKGQRQGTGRELVKECVRWCRKNQKQFLQVKTLDASNPDVYYGKTREFYFSMGFRPVECFPTLWGEHNPCLLMIRQV